MFVFSRWMSDEKRIFMHLKYFARAQHVWLGMSHCWKSMKQLIYLLWAALLFLLKRKRHNQFKVGWNFSKQSNKKCYSHQRRNKSVPHSKRANAQNTTTRAFLFCLATVSIKELAVNQRYHTIAASFRKHFHRLSVCTSSSSCIQNRPKCDDQISLFLERVERTNKIRSVHTVKQIFHINKKNGK